MNASRILARRLRAATLALALGVSLVASLAFSPLAARGAQASTIDPTTIDTSAPTSLSLTKLEQPQEFGLPTDGLPLPDLSGYSPIDGVTFDATRVPLDHPLNTTAGWQQSLTMTLAEAHTRTQGLAPDATATTGAAAGAAPGVAEFTSLGVGLFYLEEVATPPGVVPSAPMLIVLPVQHPGNAGGWLYQVSIYPKNASVDITLGVDDAAAVTIGDTVSWSARATIPRAETLDSYVITVTLDSGLSPLEHLPTTSVSLTGSHGIVLDTADFTVTIVGQTITLALAASGLSKLVQARSADPNAGVRLDYDTAVLGDGEWQSIAQVVTGMSAGVSPAISVAAITKWGPLGVHVHERGNPAHVIPGARFKLYATAQDAAAGTNPITVGGIGEWASDAQGNILIHGLRFSNFANGLDREASDPLYRPYYLIMTQVPAGYEANIVPLEVVVTSSTQAQIALVEIWRAQGGGDLPITGGQVAGIGAMGLLLCAGGLFFVLRRRSRAYDESGS